MVSGSTHSFLDPKAIELSGCVLEPTLKLLVTVVDGSKVVSNAKCSSFKWSMQGYEFENVVRLLPLGPGAMMQFWGSIGCKNTTL